MWKRKIIWPITWVPILRSSFNFAKDALLHLLLPRTCYACGKDLPFRAEDPLCAACAAQVRFVAGGLYCRRCGQPLRQGGAHCFHCRGSKSKKYPCAYIRSAVVFNPQVRALVHPFKYAHQTYLAASLGGWLGQAWPDFDVLHTAQLLMPVPLYPAKQKKRGYNQAALLARQLGRITGLMVDENSLCRIRNTPSQTGFGREQRAENMKGAFVCRQPEAVKGKVVLLIDDVATTGATLEACAAALKQAGAKQVMAYTLARDV